MTYRITFAVSGRARFLSHLETVDMLLGALRRAGFEIALSRGPKPRPVIALAVPRAVGVESLGELVDVDLLGEHDPVEVAERLANQLPLGITVLGADLADGKSAASRVQRVCYAAEVADDIDWNEALALFGGLAEAMVVRTAPDKPDKPVDVKRFCTTVHHEPGRLVFDIELSPEGAARPEEVVQAVAAAIGATPTINRLVRTQIVLREQPVGVTQ
ncbi:MAG: TIGR03936 family radical SAM-associated protein [Gaiellales bacterium]